MGKCIALVLLISVAALAVPAPLSEGEVYYWRDFKGEIPKDALSAGLDSKGNPIYIGQSIVEDRLIPGKIFVGDDKLYYELGEKAWSVNEGIKILCTENPEIFEWVPTSIYKIRELSDKFLVKGGYEPGFSVYIGRKQEKEETNVGKVVCLESRCYALYTALNGKNVEYHNYEILTYNPDDLNAINANDVSQKEA